ncbi:related to formamidopyrimidine-DNA glycosylase [Lecanosticta acicola]|uniref:Related to formamidopyrimidine-DNA glycosylase n=1 Tax=Lecanosticta acicola TaxID=111012 RepID=A0AAI9ED00_9PEZI|nr:related to formamidopyrimidine-DNA glycosylase [Lecanosticta acicola]
MPEIGEVARIVHFLRKHLVNRTIKSCQAFEDEIVYGKVGCSASAFEKAVTGKKVMGAGQQGKYFYVTFDKGPHSIMHLGMTGWIKFNAEETGYYKQAKETATVEEWPPKYMKWLVKCEAEKINGEDRESVEVAFIDARRLARIRLIDCDADNIRNETPLKENGPDPVIDKDTVTVEWLAELLGRKRVPVKALLLDQANISGVGNWVADEVLYQAKIHPEQYSNTFAQEEVKRLHDALIDVCTTACETLADSTKFPEKWLMKYRWGKGKKDSNVLPNGEKIVHLKVGGRTSAIVPSVQKKTSGLSGDVDLKDDDEEEEEKPAKGRKRKAKAEEEEEEEEEGEEVLPAKKDRGKKAKAKTNDPATATKKGRRSKKTKAEEDEEEEEEGEEVLPAKKDRGKKAKAETNDPAIATNKGRRSKKTKAEPADGDAEPEEAEEETKPTSRSKATPKPRQEAKSATRPSRKSARTKSK